MSAEFLPREAFADEQSYIAHRRHVAALQRAERLKQQEAKRPKPKRGEKKPLTGALLTFHKMQAREKKRKYWMCWYYENGGRARLLEHCKRWQKEHPERHVETQKRWRLRHYDECLLRDAVYRQGRTVEQRARKREYHREYDALHKERLREQQRQRRAAQKFDLMHAQETNARDREIVRLRDQEGRRFKEIALRFGLTHMAVSGIYRRYLQRQQHEQSA